MAAQKVSKVITRRRKFIVVDVPEVRMKIEIAANSAKEIEGRNAKIDLTRQLKGKSIETQVKVFLENDKPVAHPIKIKLMPYFIRRMIRKRISYVEDSFDVKSQNSLILIKPFLITRNKVSKAVRRTLRNKCRNWLEDYISERKDNEIFSEIFSNRLQKSLSLYLKKTYPLSLCEIRILEVKRKLAPEEIPEIKEKPKAKEKKIEEPVEYLDQMKEIEEEMIKKAQTEIKETQEKASKIEEEIKPKEEKKKKELVEEEKVESEEKEVKPKKIRKKKEEKKDE